MKFTNQWSEFLELCFTHHYLTDHLVICTSTSLAFHSAIFWLVCINTSMKKCLLHHTKVIVRITLCYSLNQHVPFVCTQTPLILTCLNRSHGTLQTHFSQPIQQFNHLNSNHYEHLIILSDIHLSIPSMRILSKLSLLFTMSMIVL